jgi:hypothetical protein
MKYTFVAVALALASTAAVASPTCNAPKEKWMKQSEFRSMLEKQGYHIKRFEVTKGKCYEIYGYDKNKKRVEMYFNPETGAVVKRK